MFSSLSVPRKPVQKAETGKTFPSCSATKGMVPLFNWEEMGVMSHYLVCFGFVIGSDVITMIVLCCVCGCFV